MSVVVSKLSFSYGKNKVLSDVSFSAEAGELLAVLGPNGVGKSTLFRCIMGLLPRYDGEITVNGKAANEIAIREMAKIVAYIPQSHAPVFNYSVFDVVLMGTSAQVSAVNTPRRKQLELAESAIDRLGVTHLRDRGYMQISGGERQLVLIARALAQNAKILVMDEPTSSLDYGNQIRILSQIKKLTVEGYTVIQSTHNPDQAFLFADKVLALLDGHIIKYGTPYEVISGDLIKKLYNVDVEVQSLYMDKARVCLPKSIIRS